MGQLVAVGIGAGLVAALLFGVVAVGSPAGMLLSYLAPLPILIVALGWHHLVGLLGVFAGALAISLALRSGAGLAFALGPALPAWWLACLTLTGRTVSETGTVVWTSPGRLLLWTAITGGLVALAAAIGLGGGDHAQFADALRRATETLLRSDVALPRQGPGGTIGGISTDLLVRLFVLITPAVAGAVFTLTLALNLWLGAKAVSMSGRLPRHWSPVPETRMPGVALALLASAILVATTAGWAGIAGRALAGAMTMAFAFQGLALVHFATRGRPGRGGVLGAAYFLTLVLGHILLPILAIAGMIDTATPLRHRLTRDGTPRGRNGPPSPN